MAINKCKSFFSRYYHWVCSIFHFNIIAKNMDIKLCELENTIENFENSIMELKNKLTNIETNIFNEIYHEQKLRLRQNKSMQTTLINKILAMENNYNAKLKKISEFMELNESLNIKNSPIVDRGYMGK